ncbi:MAG TPA: NAD(P)H-dependent oxidoreductase [Anaeromyxobacteraceae bacterium]|nr:NAD(P)H-dependent oxidoreductase [Anaeromyxobacteraceae bacterium]
MKLLLFAASLRKDSLNRKLARLAADALRAAGASVDHADFHEFDMPLYDGDLEKAEGLPLGAVALRDRLAAADGLVLVTPEYNHSIPGTLKNAIDWVSRARPVPLKGRPALLLSASPGLAGGSRASWAVRVPLELLGTFLFPDHFALPRADQAFGRDGAFVDPKNQARLEALVKEYLAFAEAVSALVPRRVVGE